MASHEDYLDQLLKDMEREQVNTEADDESIADILSALDVKTGKLEIIGKLVPTDEYIDMFDQHTFVAGMDFDKYGVLWYSTMSFRVQEDEHYKAPSGLYRWDFLNGKEPEFLGIFGTPERVQTYTDSLFVDKNTDKIMLIIAILNVFKYHCAKFVFSNNSM